MTLVRRLTGRDRGAATAELAVSLPCLLLVLAVCAYAVLCAAAQLRCADASRLAARAAARGESGADVTRTALAAAPSGARVTQRRDGDLVVVEVRVQVRPRGLAALLRGVVVTGRATAAVEPGVRS